MQKLTLECLTQGKPAHHAHHVQAFSLLCSGRTDKAAQARTLMCLPPLKYLWIISTTPIIILPLTQWKLIEINAKALIAFVPPQLWWSENWGRMTDNEMKECVKGNCQHTFFLAQVPKLYTGLDLAYLGRSLGFGFDWVGLETSAQAIFSANFVHKSSALI